MAWLEDAAVRLITVLALDRFADFIGDEVSEGYGHVTLRCMHICLVIKMHETAHVVHSE